MSYSVYESMMDADRIDTESIYPEENTTVIRDLFLAYNPKK